MQKETGKVYGLYDPVSGQIRYVGITGRSLEERLRGHLKDKSASHKNSWIMSLAEKGLVPQIRLIREVPFSDLAKEEVKEIQFQLSIGSNLTNHATGGNGPFFGLKNDSKQRISMSLMGNKRRLGKPHSVEVRSRISATLRNNPNGGSFKKGHVIPGEIRLKMSESHKKNKLNIERATAVLAESREKTIEAATKIFAEDVRLIYVALKTGSTRKELASKYGVSVETIRKIALRMGIKNQRALIGID